MDLRSIARPCRCQNSVPAAEASYESVRVSGMADGHHFFRGFFLGQWQQYVLVHSDISRGARREYRLVGWENSVRSHELQQNERCYSLTEIYFFLLFLCDVIILYTARNSTEKLCLG